MIESQNLEWKASWHDDHLKSVCAFANADGGTLEIGRDDHGAVVGIGARERRRLLEELPNKLRDLLGIVASVKAREEDGVPYLRIVVERYPVPISYREALLKAVVHRDYAVPTPIQIQVHDDRLQIYSAGSLPEGWTLERLLGPHPSQPFNPDIANAFFWAGEIETWGRGIDRVFRACRTGRRDEHLDLQRSTSS